MNGPSSPERPDDEELPLIPLSPDLDLRQRAKALSQLSLQSLGSDLYDVADAGDDALVGIATLVELKKHFSLINFACIPFNMQKNERLATSAPWPI